MGASGAKKCCLIPLPAADIVTTWLNSSAHRDILLDRSWCELGVSALHDSSAPGDFEGREATIVTADFGCRHR